ncbi:MAG: hypothetical protein UT55_C0020G0004 [Candidatus Peregrinibacteria bacterium GW2011_GWE2_39_6]|nr:MAG: hypothetical protein UT36_C0015G0004 [Candidatus Peregrinibacteria bacterium GW2011_GWF2_39_17]KKR26029.1 MAG: hypothetical protein UT55_C0020G0004 [Candidatus Peregrinibacteria bacterium GW2011_GWE2_39_6]HCW32044.1 hypothetical protein [Candidatus Peregrinibacteria bacterium]
MLEGLLKEDEDKRVSGAAQNVHSHQAVVTEVARMVEGNRGLNQRATTYNAGKREGFVLDFYNEVQTQEDTIEGLKRKITENSEKISRLEEARGKVEALPKTDQTQAAIARAKIEVERLMDEGKSIEVELEAAKGDLVSMRTRHAVYVGDQEAAAKDPIAFAIQNFRTMKDELAGLKANDPIREHLCRVDFDDGVGAFGKKVSDRILAHSQGREAARCQSEDAITQKVQGEYLEITREEIKKLMSESGAVINRITRAIDSLTLEGNDLRNFLVTSKTRIRELQGKKYWWNRERRVEKDGIIIEKVKNDISSRIDPLMAELNDLTEKFRTFFFAHFRLAYEKSRREIRTTFEFDGEEESSAVIFNVGLDVKTSYHDQGTENRMDVKRRSLVSDWEVSRRIREGEIDKFLVELQELKTLDSNKKGW